MRASPGDTIAAISTALGPGAIAIVRLTGDRAVELADTIFRGASLAECPTHTVHHGHIHDSRGREVDEVLATVMRSPNTYTTEDMVEFGCHGGAMPARRVLEACLDAGARLAERGEFTQRAFLNGRLDLVQAEAVADLVAAGTPLGLELALGQLEGTLSARLADVREAVVDFRAEVEALIDFVDDDIGPTTINAIVGLGRSARDALAGLLSHCRVGVAIREGVAVAIVGKPNVGKSSLMNALLMRDRSIVTALPGTTRDAIEECLHIEGVLVRLIDTAGWREATDEAEQAGVERARAAAKGADLVLLVVDASERLDNEDRSIAEAVDASRTVPVANKIDLGDVVTETELPTLLEDVGGSAQTPVARVSAVTEEGLDELRGSIMTAALGGEWEGPISVTNVRHIDALGRAAEALARAERMLLQGEPPELVAVEAADAGDALGEVTGETTPEDVLERIFARFCVGK
jgi:tRNA modification GTPase